MSKIKKANREKGKERVAEDAYQKQGEIDDELTEQNLRLVEHEFLMNYRAPVP